MKNSTRQIILLHGAIGASDQLIPLGNELKKNSFEVHYLNFSGHGQKEFESNFSIEQFSEELNSYIKKNNLQQPTIFGYSMGGYVALYLASKYKNLLGSIITLGTKFEWSPEIAAKEVKMLDAKTIMEKVPKFAEALQKRHGTNWELLLQKTSEVMTGLGNNNLLKAETFSKIENKVLIGLADGDIMVSLNETDSAASQIKNAKRYTLQNTKHPIETANVIELSKVISEFA